MVCKRSFAKIFLILIFILGSISISRASTSQNLTIFSEANMTYALTKIVREYSKKENIIISVNFNSSYNLIDNIDLGEPADIFISSHSDWIKNLSQKGLVDQFNSANFAKDKLVLITSKNNRKINLKNTTKTADFNDMLQLISARKVPLIIGSDYSSLGRYTKKILDDSQISNFQIFQKFDEDKKSIIDFINEHNDYCAIVMESEIKNDDNIIILSHIYQIVIDYKGLVIAGDNMENARKFIKYLKSDEAKKILLEEGFIVPPTSKML